MLKRRGGGSDLTCLTPTMLVHVINEYIRALVENRLVRMVMYKVCSHENTCMHGQG